MDELPPPAALPVLRRDRPAAAGSERHRLPGRGRLVARPARLRAWCEGHLRDVPRTARAARGHPRRRQPDRDRHRRDLALRDGARSGPVRGPVRRRALRRHQGAARLVAAGVRRLRVGARAGPGALGRRDPGGTGRPAGACHRGPAPSARRSRTPSGPDRARLRPEPGRPAPDPGPRPPRRDRHHPARRGASRTASWRTRPLRTAQATDSYTLRGDPGGEDWEPEFTLHGFRYAEVSGDYDDLAAVAMVYHSDLERTGWFSCSDELLTRLHENVVWGMRGNFVDVPTDCPQRDERLGWTGDLQVFAPTAAYLYDCAGFLASWLKDLAADQTPAGTVPLFVPRVDFPGPFAAARADGRVGRRRGDRAVGGLPAVRRRGPAAAAVPEHAGLGRRADRRAGARHAVRQAGHAARRLARPGRAARRSRGRRRPTRTWWRPPTGRTSRTCSRGSPRCSARRPTPPSTPTWPRASGRRSTTST